MGVVLDARNITKIYESGFVRTTQVKALDRVNLRVSQGEIISIVGESGSGKTTLAKIIARIEPPTSGDVVFLGKNVWKDIREKEDIKWFYRNLNIILQDPYAVFNPFHKVDRVLEIALKLNGIDPSSEEGKKSILEAVKSVGLNPQEVLGRYPHQLSGGQKQRLIVARLYLIKPKLIISDEPVSMVDPSLRALILKLLVDLVQATDSSMIFITHDIGLAYHVATRMIVLYKGRIVEEGSPEEIVSQPREEYTRTLISSLPRVVR
ncbi:MAG: ABC transporter ATP-binding protein [Infirmifilum sp.]|jgi:peptide/nickel transport system ATP-binding protein|uniref:ABC transporter ATP-binding protein n=1 Tax=Infirmifilum TaxID=2856573 RepID=UPI003C7911FD